jgi:hypothetical protein
MSGDLDLEQRYRRVLRLLPGYYRDKWEEDMVAAFLDSWMTGDPDEDSVTMEFDRPSRQEVVSVIGLAARLYLGGAAVTMAYQPATSHQPALYGLNFTLPAAEAAALTAITTKAFDTRDQMAVSTGGKTWGVLMAAGPFTNGQFGILVQSENQALQLQRILIPPG